MLELSRTMSESKTSVTWCWVWRECYVEWACSVDLDGALPTVLEVGQRTLRVCHAVLLRLKHILTTWQHEIYHLYLDVLVLDEAAVSLYPNKVLHWIDDGPANFIQRCVSLHDSRIYEGGHGDEEECDDECLPHSGNVNVQCTIFAVHTFFLVDLNKFLLVHNLLPWQDQGLRLATTSLC